MFIAIPHTLCDKLGQTKKNCHLLMFLFDILDFVRKKRKKGDCYCCLLREFSLNNTIIRRIKVNPVNNRQ